MLLILDICLHRNHHSSCKQHVSGMVLFEESKCVANSNRIAIHVDMLLGDRHMHMLRDRYRKLTYFQQYIMLFTCRILVSTAQTDGLRYSSIYVCILTTIGFWSNPNETSVYF